MNHNSNHSSSISGGNFTTMTTPSGNSRGLPGFLRRSLRPPYEEGDDDKELEEETREKVDEKEIVESQLKNAKLDSNTQTTILAQEGEKLSASMPLRSERAKEDESSSSLSSSAAVVTAFPDSRAGGGRGFRIPGTRRSVSWGTSSTTGSGGDQQEEQRRSTYATAGGQPGSDDRNTLHSSNGDTTDKTKKKSYKETMFEKTITASVVNMRDLRQLGWNGIPTEYRSEAWQILLGYLPANASRRTQTLRRKRAEYRDAIAQHYDIDDNTRTMQEQETLRQVLVDVPRTAPDVGLFRNDRVRQCLTRLLYIWAMRHPASSYVQGINDLATPLIAVFLSGYFGGEDILGGEIMDEVSDEVMAEVEADCYWCLTNLLAGIQDHYTSDQPGVQRMVMRLEELVNRIDAELTDHLRNTGVEFMQFAFKWMNCLLLREFNLRCVIRLWDTYLSEGEGGFEDFHIYVCAAFLCQFSAQLRTMEFDELFGFMQNMPTEEWGDTEVEVLLSQAFVLSTLFAGSDAHLTATPRR